MESLQVTLPVIGAIIIAVLINNKRLDDMQKNFENRISDLRELMQVEFASIKERLERLEHPVDRG